MIARLCAAIVRWLKRLFPPDAELRRGGGPALDRALDDDLHVEAAERGLTGRNRDDWIERQTDRHSFRISDALYPNGSPYAAHRRDQWT